MKTYNPVLHDVSKVFFDATIPLASEGIFRNGDTLIYISQYNDILMPAYCPILRGDADSHTCGSYEPVLGFVTRLIWSNGTLLASVCWDLAQSACNYPRANYPCPEFGYETAHGGILLKPFIIKALWLSTKPSCFTTGDLQWTKQA